MSTVTKSPLLGRYQSGFSRVWLGVVAVALAAGIVVVAVVFSQSDSDSNEAGNATLEFFEIALGDLIQEDSLGGTLGSIQDDPIKTRIGGTVTSVPDPGEEIGSGETIFEIDNQPVVLLDGTTPAFRDIVMGEDAIAVQNTASGIVTWLPTRGDVLQQGDTIYEVNERPVVLLYGDTPMYRVLEEASITESAVLAQEDVELAQKYLDEIKEARDEAVAESQVQLDEAKFNYLNQLNGWFGDVVPDSHGEMSPDAIMDDWGTSFDAVFDIALAESKTPSDDVDTPWNESVVWVWMHLTPYPVLTGCDESSTKLEFRCPLAEITESWEARELAEEAHDELIDAQQVLVDGATSELDKSVESYTELTEDLIGDDIVQLQQSLVALGYASVGSFPQQGIFGPETTTAVMELQMDLGLEVDGSLDLNEAIFLPGAVQVTNMSSTLGARASGGSLLTVSTGSPAGGADIAQLESTLLDLGLVDKADGIYDSATYAAVQQFQHMMGMEQDGIIDLGEVVFLPGSVRITQQIATEGTLVGANSQIVGVSHSAKVVRLNLPANQQGLLAQNDEVTVELPDSTIVPAVVTYVAQTATVSQQGGATFEVFIELSDQTSTDGLDEAPVDVIVVSDSVENVMTVPVSVLLSLLEGGFAVEKDLGGGQIALVAVEVGFFGDNGMIEISSDQLSPGDRVVIP